MPITKSDKPADVEVRSAEEERLDPEGHDLHPILTNKEFRAAQKKALKSVEEDRRRNAMAEVERAETERLAREEGLHTGGAKDGLVDVVINLPDPDINSCLLINMQPFWHGQRYSVPQHQADTIAEMTWRLERYTAREIRGEKLSEFYMRQKATNLSGSKGVSNAPQRVAGAAARLEGTAL